MLQQTTHLRLMFKGIAGLFRNKPSQIVTMEAMEARKTLCGHLMPIYQAQISLLHPPELSPHLEMVRYYTDFTSQYQHNLQGLEEYLAKPDTTPEPDFAALIDAQLDNSISQLETINNRIQFEDLTALDAAYTTQLDTFFGDFHLNRIAASYAMTEYLSPEPIMKTVKVVDIVKNGIKTTSQVLGLNGYPVPKFILNKQGSDLDLMTTCVPPHIVHIMFEMFKNASIPSLHKQKPITVSVYKDTLPVNPTVNEFTLSTFKKTQIKSDEMVTIEIKDEGGGMPASVLAKIWQFHYTTSNDTDRDEIHGFGLGLPLCKAFANFNDGYLGLSNIEGNGVTIKIKLPRMA